MRLLVLGGTKFLGRATVDSALARGHEVTLFNRGQTNADLFPEVEKIHGAREHDLSALNGRTWDAIVDPSGYTPGAVRASAELLADSCAAFEEHCARGIEPDEARIKEHLDASLMLVTALTPHIGYEKSAKIALTAHRQGLSLREAALKLGYVTAEQFDAWVRPADMTHPMPD